MLTDLKAFNVGAPLHALTFYKQWLLFQRTTWDDIKKKWDKKPIQANGWGMPWRSDPEKLMSYADAVAALATRDDCALGFVLSEADPFFCLDIDHCAVYDKDDVHTRWSDKALELINMLPLGVVEVSMSGNGLHVFGSALDLPHACDNDHLGAEFYTKQRAMALTGLLSSSSNTVENDCTFDVINLVDEYFPRTEREVRKDGEGATLDDLERAREAIPFIDSELNYNDWLGVCMALHAAGVEADAEDTAFQIAQDYTAASSKYIPGYLEHKWSSFHADGGLTLGTLFHHAKQGGFKTREEVSAAEAFAAHEASVLPPKVPAVRIEEHQQGIRYPNEYLNFFANFMYVRNLHCVWTPEEGTLDQKRFDAEYGGYQFALDMQARKCTDSPWEAFLKCRVYKFKRVHKTCFRPELPGGEVIAEEGKTAVNVYYPIPVDRSAGDVEPFLTHLEKILPDERDRRILLTYMAALVQKPGIKFQWAPLLQGCEGNGKTFFTLCTERAVGFTYSHRPNVKDLDNKFNLWMLNKLIICVEDVYIPGFKGDLIEALKPMITSDRIEIQGKGGDQATLPVCANFMFNSNHRNALGNAVKGRRYCVFYTAQQEDHHLIRDGLDGAYFTQLYQWARGGGFAHVTEYLHTYPLDAEFNPAAGCTRAPATSTYAEVMEEALGTIEQEVMAAVNEERQGFMSPWISSLALDRLLAQTGYDKRMPRNKRRQMLESLGYVRHPHLNDGRTNNAVTPDNGKTTLFVKKGHLELELQGPALIAEYYSKSQQAVSTAVSTAFSNNL